MVHRMRRWSGSVRGGLGVRIVAKKRLMDLARAHGDCVKHIEDWYNIARKARWHNLVELHRTHPSADDVDGKIVFNIKGNAYRLIVSIWYEGGVIYIKDLLTHSDYDKGAWKTRKA
jgi:mRNA interferase HigB